MQTIQETFLELDWGDATQARQARDQRVTELQAEGFDCTCENLYAVSGHRVFLLEATKVKVADPSSTKTKESPNLRSKRPSHRPSFEER